MGQRRREYRDSSRDASLCSQPDVIYAIITEYGLIILTGLYFVLQPNFSDYNSDDGKACRFLLENLLRMCVQVSMCVRACVFVLLGGYSMPKRFYFVTIIMQLPFFFFFLFFFIRKRNKKNRIIVENTARGGSTCSVHLLTALSFFLSFFFFFLNAFVTDAAVYAVVLTLYSVNFLCRCDLGVAEELVKTESFFFSGTNSVGVNKRGGGCRGQTCERAVQGCTHCDVIS